jgi:hypothetical protein
MFRVFRRFFKKNTLNQYWHLGICVLALSSLLVFSGRTTFQPNVQNSDSSPSALPLPQRLTPVPSIVKSVYLTGYSAGNANKIKEIIGLADTTELNSVIIDIKDYTGKVFFQTDSLLIQQIGSEEIRIPDFEELIKKLHQHQIYVIARIAVFQDMHLAKTRPDLAVKNSQTGAVWKDRKGLTWIDPAATEAWDYNLEVAKQAIKLGVDEINLDYVRFPSDGQMNFLSYPVYNPALTAKAKQMQKFFAYVHDFFKDQPVKTSADLFGLTTVNQDDLGIGQVMEYALPYFDYICPMVYPSHYAAGFWGYSNPAAYPYEVVRYSMTEAQNRRQKLQYALDNNNLDPEKSTASTTILIITHLKIDDIDKNSRLGELRPWLQVFDLGAVYTPEMVRKQIQATNDSGLNSGWYLWNPSNIYSESIFIKQ